MVLFVVAFHLAEILAGFVALIQFLWHLCTRRPLPELQNFGDSLARYVRALIAYLTYATEERPFPFAAWPRSSMPPVEPEEAEAKAGAIC
jgi:hypothetical protein